MNEGMVNTFVLSTFLLFFRNIASSRFYSSGMYQYPKLSFLSTFVSIVDNEFIKIISTDWKSDKSLKNSFYAENLKILIKTAKGAKNNHNGNKISVSKIVDLDENNSICLINISGISPSIKTKGEIESIVVFIGLDITTMMEFVKQVKTCIELREVRIDTKSVVYNFYTYEFLNKINFFLILFIDSDTGSVQIYDLREESCEEQEDLSEYKMTFNQNNTLERFEFLRRIDKIILISRDIICEVNDVGVNYFVFNIEKFVEQLQTSLVSKANSGK